MVFCKVVCRKKTDNTIIFNGFGSMKKLSMNKKYLPFLFFAVLVTLTMYESAAQESHQVLLPVELRVCLPENGAADEPIFQILQNPVETMLEIRSTTSTFFMSLYDGGGKKLISNKFNEGTASINCSQFASGIYFITLTDLDVKEQYKLIIK